MNLVFSVRIHRRRVNSQVIVSVAAPLSAL